MPEIIQEADGRLVLAHDGAAFRMDAPEYARFTLETPAGIKLASLGAVPGEFPETLALRSPRRTHVLAGGSEVSLEASNTIPFGAEAALKHEFLLTPGAVGVTTDFILRNSFQMKSISAGGLEFSGTVAKIGVTPFPRCAGPVPAPEWREVAQLESGTVLYDGAEPPLRLIAASPDGAEVEFEAGEDLWRWCNASRAGGSARYTAIWKDGLLTFTWQLFTWQPAAPDDPPPAGRNWRIRYRLLWRSPKKKSARSPKYKAVFDASAFAPPESAFLCGRDGEKVADRACYSASKSLNALKKWLRQQLGDAKKGDVFALTGVTPALCFSAAHMERARLGELAHWDGPALAEFSRWADRQLAAKGARLVLSTSV